MSSLTHAPCNGAFFLLFQPHHQPEDEPTPEGSVPRAHDRDAGTPPEPFNSTPMGVNSISPGPPHVRPMWALSTCGEPDEIKKNAHPKNTTALFGEQANSKKNNEALDFDMALEMVTGSKTNKGIRELDRDHVVCGT